MHRAPTGIANDYFAFTPLIGSAITAAHAASYSCMSAVFPATGG